ncbi:vWA domain-containing protein [Thorsellia anophelis]|uniref:Ca-activated chloride channel family protein n=1 Tax=Thorsellia anophelis DSM 18579 TaxID=1123402 RepID=A0A1H9Z764_9GAMM|nr:VWA domain-containing protein [Thorsellia anophelis]SES77292.1 Ca-activated chloride channel family protein [Thorsellia anophelis DSM 18579]
MKTLSAVLKNKMRKTIPSLFAITAMCMSHLAGAQNVTINAKLASPVILPNETQSNFLKVALIGDKIKSDDRKVINLTLVIDKSGSMEGDRIQKAKEAAILAVNQLDKHDILSIVTYDDVAEVIIPATKLTDKAEMIQLIENRIDADGGTALFAGLSKGLVEVDKFKHTNQINRIILLSDGQANVGPSSTHELGELGVIAAKQSIAVTTIGLGEGYNESLMAAIASYSDGNHAYVQNSDDLDKIFVKEFDDVMSVIAQNVVVNIELENGAKPIRLWGREGTIDGNTVRVKLNQLYANQEKYVLLELQSPTEKTTQSVKSDGKVSVAKVYITYDDLYQERRVEENQLLAIEFNDDKEKVQMAQQQDVIVESLIQQNTERRKEAVNYLKSGDKAAAESSLNASYEYLEQNLSGITDGAAAAKLRTQIENEKSVLSEMQNPAASAPVLEKKITEDVYKTNQQQRK